MLSRLATLLDAHGGRVLIGALICAVVAGVFGVGVSKSLWPYSADDPASQSVKAKNRFEASAWRQIDAGVVALVSSGSVGTAAARQRVGQVAAELRGQPNVARVQSFYATHDAAMVSHDRRSTYVLAYLLTLSAMFGLLVLVFQDGHLQGLLSFRSEGALDATQPIFLFAVGFGLATDYGVFLLSRIKEAREAGAANAEAVAVGLERTGRIVTAAALLFAVAIGAFATSQIVFIKELGIGAALAVLFDASIIRALLVPSLMRLLGSANWWAPRPLRRLHDRIGLRDGASTPSPAPTPSRA
ncbi:MAG: putative drug exporter of the superfamily [Solirubrobacteraceae bacterium]